MFLAKDNDDKGLSVVPVRDANDIKRISGTPAGAACVNKIRLKKSDGTDVVVIDAGNVPASPWSIDHQLADDEQIIGVYGSCKQNQKFLSLGFIVWRPPK